MSYTQHYPFNDPLEYTTSQAAVAAGLGSLSLVNRSGQNFSQPFDVDTGFTYAAANTEFASGLMRQIKKNPLDSVLGATYTTVVDASWTTNNLVTTATLTGAPTIVANRLQCQGGGNISAYYENADIGLLADEGAVKFKYTPNYSGSPGANTNWAELKDPAGNNNKLLIFQHTAGAIRISAWNSIGGAVHTAAILGSFVAVSGTTYEVELNFKASTGAIEVFINGTSYGLTPATVYTRTGTATRLYVGAGTTYLVSEGSYEDVLLFSTVQHTLDYASGYTVEETLYLVDSIDLPNFPYAGVGALQSLDALSVIETGVPHYTVEGQYWNGAAWVASDGSYAQSNIIADINTNIGTLVVVGQTAISMQVVFAASNILGSVDTMLLEYTALGYVDGYIQPITPLQSKMMGTGYADLLNLPTGTSYGIIHVVNGILKYWDGVAWVVSDGTVAQSNTKAQVIANVETLLVGSNASVFVRWVMSTTDPDQTPEIEYADVEYSFGAVENTPDICTVYGYYKDVANNPIIGAAVLFTIVKTKSSDYREANNNIVGAPVTVLTDDRGYFSVDLIRSSEYEDGATYQMSISKEADGIFTSKIGGLTKIQFTVPDAVSQDITDLITAVA